MTEGCMRCVYYHNDQCRENTGGTDDGHDEHDEHDEHNGYDEHDEHDEHDGEDGIEEDPDSCESRR